VDPISPKFQSEPDHLISIQGINDAISLVPRPHPLTRRNGLVNQVEFLGLAGALATV